MKTSLARQPSTRHKEDTAMTLDDGPARTRASRLNELWARWLSNSALGAVVGHWASKTIALPQLRRLAGAEIPWTPLRNPVSDSTVVLVTTAGVHLRSAPRSTSIVIQPFASSRKMQCRPTSRFHTRPTTERTSSRTSTWYFRSSVYGSLRPSTSLDVWPRITTVSA
jgi:hypothetical protein